MECNIFSNNWVKPDAVSNTKVRLVHGYIYLLKVLERWEHNSSSQIGMSQVWPLFFHLCIVMFVCRHIYEESRRGYSSTLMGIESCMELALNKIKKEMLHPTSPAIMRNEMHKKHIVSSSFVVDSIRTHWIHAKGEKWEELKFLLLEF